MASAIDATKPADAIPASKAELRANLATAKSEISALQTSNSRKLNTRDGLTMVPASWTNPLPASVGASLTVYSASDGQVAVRAVAATAAHQLFVGQNARNADVVRITTKTSAAPQLFLIDQNGATVMAFDGEAGNAFLVVGGAATDRGGTSALTVKGDLAVTGAIDAPVGGTWQSPVNLNGVRLWGDATGNLRRKSATNPTSDTDGTIVT